MDKSYDGSLNPCIAIVSYFDFITVLRTCFIDTPLIYRKEEQDSKLQRATRGLVSVVLRFRSA